MPKKLMLTKKHMLAIGKALLRERRNAEKPFFKYDSKLFFELESVEAVVHVTVEVDGKKESEGWCVTPQGRVAYIQWQKNQDMLPITFLKPVTKR